MNKFFSFCAVLVLSLIIGCDTTVEPIAQPIESTSSTEAVSFDKRGSNASHDRGCDRDHERNDDCNSKSGSHDNNCDGYHHRNSDNCNDDRTHSSGCQSSHNYENNCNSTSTDICDSDGIVTLYAGKTTNVGTVTVTQDANNLYVTYQTTGSWKLKETHLDISTQKYSQRGSPGQYDYQSSIGSSVTTFTYTVAKTWAAGTKIYLLAHAVVGKTSSNSCGSTETAYGGTVVKPKNGSWYGTFCYTILGTPPPTTYSISGYTFVDANSDGVKDVGETGLANAVVTLNGTTTATSDANGAYSFSGLSAGSYTVTSNVVAGYTQSSSSSVVSITTSNGTADFGYVEIPPVPTYSISGYVFDDANGDGVENPLELRISGVPVTWNGVDSVYTDNNGNYSFTNLLPGIYLVRTPDPFNGYSPGVNTATVTIVAANATAIFSYQIPVPDVVAQPVKAQ